MPIGWHIFSTAKQLVSLQQLHLCRHRGAIAVRICKTRCGEEFASLAFCIHLPCGVSIRKWSKELHVLTCAVYGAAPIFTPSHKTHSCRGSPLPRRLELSKKPGRGLGRAIRSSQLARYTARRRNLPSDNNVLRAWSAQSFTGVGDGRSFQYCITYTVQVGHAQQHECAQIKWTTDTSGRFGERVSG